jgi:hypothetical protein
LVLSKMLQRGGKNEKVNDKFSCFFLGFFIQYSFLRKHLTIFCLDEKMRTDCQ